jgi:hypothetical protein
METSRPRHLIIALSALLVLGSAGLLRATDEIPKRPSFDRYTAMMNKSPFAVATAVAPVAPTANFAKDLYVANAARLRDGDLVTIQSAIDRNMKEYLTTNAPNEHGYAISNIEWSEKPGQTKVTISKDGQFATLTFNQALMAITAPPSGPQPGTGAPGMPTVPVPAYMPPRPPNGAGLPTPPTPHTRGVIQRNPNATRPNPARPNPDAGVDQ